MKLACSFDLHFQIWILRWKIFRKYQKIRNKNRYVSHYCWMLLSGLMVHVIDRKIGYLHWGNSQKIQNEYTCLHYEALLSGYRSGSSSNPFSPAGICGDWEVLQLSVIQRWVGPLLSCIPGESSSAALWERYSGIIKIVCFIRGNVARETGKHGLTHCGCMCPHSCRSYPFLPKVLWISHRGGFLL